MTEAGRELDAQIAEQVMGVPCAHDVEAPAYSTDLGAAWQVVEKMRADGWEFSLSDTSEGDTKPFDMVFYLPGVEVVENEVAATAPLSICLAALKALETVRTLRRRRSSVGGE